MLVYPPCPPLGSLVDSERVVLRKELASIIADNNRLEWIVLQMRADLDIKDAENSGLRSLAAAQREALEGAGIKIKDMERREAYHDNPNVPPSHRSLTLLEMRREDTEERRRSSTGRRPGRARGHPGTTSKLDAGAEREDRHACAAECPECHGTSLRPRRGLPKEVVEIEVAKKEKMIVFHDLVCNGCGYVVEASRRGTVPSTILGPQGVALVGSLKQHCRVTAGQLRGFLGDAAGIRVSRATAAAMIDAAADGLQGPADAIRMQERIECNAAEADETRDRTAVRRMPEDDGTAPPGTGKNRERPGTGTPGTGYRSRTGRSRCTSTRAAPGPRSKSTCRRGPTTRPRTTGTSCTSCAGWARRTGSTRSGPQGTQPRGPRATPGSRRGLRSSRGASPPSTAAPRRWSPRAAPSRIPA